MMMTEKEDINMTEKLKCPVCGKYEFEEHDDFDICEVCGWENDGYQEEHPDYAGGANIISLNQAKKAYKSGMTVLQAEEAYRNGEF